jgi:hypothetical protein
MGERRIVPSIHIRKPACVKRAAIQLLLPWRKLRYGYAFRRIPLTQGQYAIVDPWMYEELNKYKWYAHKNKNTYYAYRAARAGEKRKSRLIKMHKEVMKINSKSEIRNPPQDTLRRKQIQNSNCQNTRIIIDHINGDGRDNRIANLRQANYSQNSQNRRKISRRCGSQYKGVRLDKRTGKWRVQICFGGRKKHLGYYNDEVEAARAYDAAAIKYHGKFAKVNFPRSGLRFSSAVLVEHKKAECPASFKTTRCIPENVVPRWLVCPFQRRPDRT